MNRRIHGANALEDREILCLAVMQSGMDRCISAMCVCSVNNAHSTRLIYPLACRAILAERRIVRVAGAGDRFGIRHVLATHAVPFVLSLMCPRAVAPPRAYGHARRSIGW